MAASAYSFLSEARRSSEKAGILVVSRFQPDLIELGGFAAEYQLLGGAIRVAERRKPAFLLHVLRNFEAAQRLDLPLRRAVPDSVGAPRDMVDLHALDQRADQPGAELRMRNPRVGKGRAELGIDIGDAEGSRSSFGSRLAL